MFQDNYNNNHIYGPDLLKLDQLKIENIIDIREPIEINICKIPNTKFIPLNILLANYERLLDKTTTYYILCHTGHRSFYVTEQLTKLGYNVVNIIGGIAAIEEYNVPY